MDWHLRAFAQVTQRLPTLKGFGRIANFAVNLYARRPSMEVTGTIDGVRMILRTSQYVDRWLLFAPQFYEAREREFVLLHLRQGDVFIDVGAYTGLYTLIAAKAVGPAGLVVAIEPDPDSFALLTRNIAMNRLSNVRALNIACSDRPEAMMLHVNEPNRAGNSLLFGSGPSVPVECRPLRTILHELGITAVAGLKVDVEGFEFRVLSGMFPGGDGPVPRFVVIEFYSEWVGAAGGSALEILARCSYRLFARYGANYIFLRQ